MTILEQNLPIIREFILLKPKIFAHIIAVSLFFFFSSPQALDSLAPTRLEFNKLCLNRPISSALKTTIIFKWLDCLGWVREKDEKLFCNYMTVSVSFFFFNQLHQGSNVQSHTTQQHLYINPLLSQFAWSAERGVCWQQGEVLDHRVRQFLCNTRLQL